MRLGRGQRQGIDLASSMERVKAEPLAAQKENVAPAAEKNAPKKKRTPILCDTPPTNLRQRRGNEYMRGVCIGEGGFARCFEVIDQRGLKYAAKVISKKSLDTEKTKAKLFGEIRVHESMEHGHIVKYHECFEDDANVYLILELCENKSLSDLLRRRKRLSEPEVRLLLLQILGALKYMHSKRVIHRDLKLGNILLDSGMNIKISDFGLAALLATHGERKMTICGTPNYIAPEILYGKDAGHSYEVDLWSTGVVMYAMLYGKPPFQDKDVKVIYKKIKHGSLDFPDSSNVSEDAKDLIRQLLQQDPLSRPSMDKISQHPFFYSGPVLHRIPLSALTSTPQPPLFGSRIAQRREIEAIASKAGIGYGNVAGVAPNSAMKILVGSSAASAAAATRILPETLSPRDRAVSVMRMKDAPTGRLVSSRLRACQEQTDKGPDSSEASWKTANEPAPSLQRRKHEVGTTADSEDARSQQTNSSEAPRRITTRYPSIKRNDTAASVRAAMDRTKLLLAHKPYRTPQRYNSLQCQTPFLHKWVDYSHRYGLGYELSNGVTGVYFNDETGLLLDKNGLEYTYLTQSISGNMQARCIKTGSYPTELKKKVYLLNSFRSFMQSRLDAPSHTSTSSSGSSSTGEPLFLSHFIRQTDVTLFRLSDGTIQANFSDHGKLSVFSETGIQLIDGDKRVHYFARDSLVPRYMLVRDDLRLKLERVNAILSAWLGTVE